MRERYNVYRVTLKEFGPTNYNVLGRNIRDVIQILGCTKQNKVSIEMIADSVILPKELIRKEPELTPARNPYEINLYDFFDGRRKFVDIRVSNRLFACGIENMGQLLERMDELLTFRNIGKVSVKYINQRLREEGFIED